MPTIFDNINQTLLPHLRQTLDLAYRADFCVGYFNLRGWRELDGRIQQWTGGEGAQCRLLVGMQKLGHEELRDLFSFQEGARMDNAGAVRIKNKLLDDFRRQLMFGAPTNADESGLRRLAAQLRQGQVVVKLFLRHSLHAKLYLLFRHDHNTPIVSYMGSSNLTFSGLSGQGELNVDVVEQDAANKLAQWFEDRWQDRFCLDISDELAKIIDDSWAGEKLLPPYYIYLKMAYHLSHEARAGLSEFAIPRIFGNQLFDFQTAAVQIAARHLNQRGGVLIGDVVGLGKTLMATAVAKIFENDFLMDTLIICPKTLVAMWQDYVDKYDLRAKVLSITRVQSDLPNMKRFRLVLIDESHNLRNREGKRYRAIKEYIQKNESRCLLLSATPYNKSYQDLSSQLRLFLDETADLGIRPESLLREIGETELRRRYQCDPRSLTAFEKSESPADWRELMSLFMVRRTRSFIRDNYAQLDPANGRRYLTFGDGRRAYFPTRHPRRVSFTLDDNDPYDQYARLYADDVVEAINALNLPRYGLGNYAHKKPAQLPNPAEQKILDDLSRGGRRLMGFSRTNLFKRLESSGYAFLLSVERHILRNYIFIYALENGLPLPIGSQGAEMLDTRFEDEDAEAVDYDAADLLDEDGANDLDDPTAGLPTVRLLTESAFHQQAQAVYELYSGRYRRRFKWIRSNLFDAQLVKDLRADAQALTGVLRLAGEWDAGRDAQLNALVELLTVTYPRQKVLIFSQFADTVRYLERQLQARGVRQMAGVTGNDKNPTAFAWKFSPVSNEKRDQIGPEEELRVLIATDVLSEGQNLQDAHVVVNFDLPWAIIRLIQRAGRVDRIGQQSADIYCHAFLPADGVERIIRLRERLRNRLHENAEVVGTDEAFFDDEADSQPLIDLYHEKSGILDEEPDGDVDLVSHAYQIWKNATDANPPLKPIIENLPDVVYATKGRSDLAVPGASPATAHQTRVASTPN
jgi:superfamily II DNA or RNA helicase